jgi:hypothetical protein
MFIRLFADTTGSALSYYALEYMRSMMRTAPVRLASVTGVLAGRWQAYGQLLATPMLGHFVNVVCCDPSRWTWIEKVPAGERAVDHREIGDDKEIAIPATAETISGRVELYTAGHRNLLFAVAPPRSSSHLTTALKYEAIVVPTEEHASGWRKHGLLPTVLGAPPKGDPSRDTLADYHKTMRNLLLPGETQ